MQMQVQVQVPDAMPSLEVGRPKKGSWLWPVWCWAKTNLVLLVALLYSTVVLSVHHAVCRNGEKGPQRRRGWHWLIGSEACQRLASRGVKRLRFVGPASVNVLQTGPMQAPACSC